MQAADFLSQAQSEMVDRSTTYDKPEGERSMAAAVGRDGHPRTILTKDMIRKKKWALKRQRRGIFGPRDKNKR